MFLIGLQKIVKGDWRGIGRNYVVSTVKDSYAGSKSCKKSILSGRAMLPEGEDVGK